MSLLSIFSLIAITVILIGVAIGRYPVLRMNRATIVLVGTAILIFVGSISLEQAFLSIDLHTITLLFAMMIINVNLRLCGFFDLITKKVILHAKTPRQLLTLIIFSSGILSAIFLNDTIVLVFTPLVLEITTALKRNPIPYLVATATAANVGSTATIIGNPQNMIIGIASGIPFTEFAFYLTPAALGGLVIDWFIIVIIYRKEFKKERLFYPDNQRVRLYLPLFYKSIIASVMMMIAFILGVSVPLAALGGASFLLITRRLKPERVFREIDWSLLIFFAGLFVVTAAVETSGLSKHLFSTAIPFLEDGLFSFSMTAAVISNLVSNVPAVLLFKPVIPLMVDQNMFWLTLGMATTFAGNLTLLGSVANLIVAESAKSRGVHLSFVEYLKAGIPITVFTLLWGILWMGIVF